MNYDLLLTAMMANHLRGVLRSGRAIPFAPPPRFDGYHLVFECAPHSFKSKFRRAPITTVDDWVQYELTCGLTDATLWRPLAGEEYHLYGFAGYGSKAIICRYKNGDAAAFVPKSIPNPAEQTWTLRYTENHLVSYDVPGDAYHDNTADFGAVLEEIASFAEEIGFPWFAERYREARAILTGDCPCDRDLPLPHMSEVGKRLLNAANVADLFGCMGSWNDSPPYYAREKGRTEDYERLSDSLFFELRMAVLYAANHP